MNVQQSPPSPTMQHSLMSQVSNVSMKPFWNVMTFLLVSTNFTRITTDTDFTHFAGYWPQYHKELCVLVSTLHCVYFVLKIAFSRLLSIGTTALGGADDVALNIEIEGSRHCSPFLQARQSVPLRGEFSHCSRPHQRFFIRAGWC